MEESITPPEPQDNLILNGRRFITHNELENHREGLANSLGRALESELPVERARRLQGRFEIEAEIEEDVARAWEESRRVTAAQQSENATAREAERLRQIADLASLGLLSMDTARNLASEVLGIALEEESASDENDATEARLAAVLTRDMGERYYLVIEDRTYVLEDIGGTHHAGAWREWVDVEIEGVHLKGRVFGRIENNIVRADLPYEQKGAQARGTGGDPEIEMQIVTGETRTVWHNHAAALTLVIQGRRGNMRSCRVVLGRATEDTPLSNQRSSGLPPLRGLDPDTRLVLGDFRFSASEVLRMEYSQGFGSQRIDVTVAQRTDEYHRFRSSSRDVVATHILSHGGEYGSIYFSARCRVVDFSRTHPVNGVVTCNFALIAPTFQQRWIENSSAARPQQPRTVVEQVRAWGLIEWGRAVARGGLETLLIRNILFVGHHAEYMQFIIRTHLGSRRVRLIGSTEDMYRQHIDRRTVAIVRREDADSLAQPWIDRLAVAVARGNFVTFMPEDLLG